MPQLKPEHLLKTLIKSDQTLSITDLQKKYEKMALNPFNFFRGSAPIFYSYFNHWKILPTSWQDSDLSTWLIGDLHLQNLGFQEENSGKIVFSFNDFDDAFIGPFYIDLLRFCSSIFIASPQFSFKGNDKKLESLLLFFLNHYKKSFLNLLEGKPAKLELKGFLLKKALKLHKKRSFSSWQKKWLLPKTTLFNVPTQKLFPVPAAQAQSLRKMITPLLSDQVVILDLAERKFSGIGSLGVNKYFILTALTDKVPQPKLYMAKSQKTPNYTYASNLVQPQFQRSFTDKTERIVLAARALQPFSLPHISHFSFQQQNYILKPISFYKKEFLPENFKKWTQLKDFLKYTAELLSHAHFQASTPSAQPLFRSSIRQFFKLNSSFALQINKHAKAFCDTNTQCFQLFGSGKKYFREVPNDSKNPD